MAIVTKEPRIVVVALDMVGGEVQTVAYVLPIRDQRCHIIVHGQVRVPVHLPSDQAEIPPTGVMGVVEVPEIEGLRGGHDEKVTNAWILIYIPIGGPG
jgi:hypothetical protein